jgi:hypothetical protein
LIYRNILLLDLVKQKPVKLGELRRRMNAMALKSDCIDPRQFFLSRNDITVQHLRIAYSSTKGLGYEI